MLKLVVGLGNPGQQYTNTRHNAGFWMVDGWAGELNSTWTYEKKFKAQVVKFNSKYGMTILLKPETYMNLSGDTVQAALDYFHIKKEEILVVHDELDLLPGQLRLKISGGHGGHNGLRDIIAKIGGGEFKRLRIGIGRPVGKIAVANYVLSAPSIEDMLTITNSIKKSLLHIDELLQCEVDFLMRTLHV